jgi:DHA2 family multidrug resistance protein
VWMDQRLLLALGCALNAAGLYAMANLTLSVDYWTLAWPRFFQGLGLGFIFVPLTTLALATIPKARLGNATAAYNVLRNVGGSAGVALAATLLSRRSQSHQSTLVGHVTAWSPETTGRLAAWADHFAAQGGDALTAQRRALAMLYRDTVTQAQVLAYADLFLLMAAIFAAAMVLVPFMSRVRAEPAPVSMPAPGAPAPAAPAPPAD